MGATSSTKSECSLGGNEQAKKLMEDFRRAVMLTAGIATDGVCDACGFAGNSCACGSQKLQAFFEKSDLNHDGKIDKEEMDLLIQRLNLDTSEEMKNGLRANMKTLLFTLDDSIHVVFSEFLSVLTAPEEIVCKQPLYSKEKKRIVFVGATGAGKSALCSVLSGLDNKNTTYKIGKSASSETTECRREVQRWFGDENEEEFVCIDTPGEYL